MDKLEEEIDLIKRALKLGFIWRMYCDGTLSLSPIQKFECFDWYIEEWVFSVSGYPIKYPKWLETAVYELENPMDLQKAIEITKKYQQNPDINIAMCDIKRALKLVLEAVEQEEGK